MAMLFEELRVLQSAEEIADNLWKEIVSWNNFSRDTVGKQFTRAADSVGANIAEAYGRYHYGEKLQFLYYARGSLFETKYWLNRARTRRLIPENQAQNFADLLSTLAHQLNTFAKTIKANRAAGKKTNKIMREPQAMYQTQHETGFESFVDNDSINLFTPKEIAQLANLAYPPDTHTIQ